MFTRSGYERLYNIQQGDVWGFGVRGGYILDEFAPVGRDHISNGDGFSTMNEQKYEKKSEFLPQRFLHGRKNRADKSQTTEQKSGSA